jgi:hypothetical protein
MPRYSWESPDQYLAALKTAETEEERDNLLLILAAIFFVGAYRNVATGRTVAPSIVRAELDRYIVNSNGEIRALAERLRAGQINIADWHTAMRRQIKNVHLNAVAAANGGFNNMTARTYGQAGGFIRSQYDFLRGFADQIISGEQPLDGTLIRRAEMYNNAGRRTYHKAVHDNLSDVEQASGRRAVIGSTLNPADHCEECVNLDGRWFFLSDKTAVTGTGRYKDIGDRICRTNCQCNERTGFYVNGEIIST